MDIFSDGEEVIEQQRPAIRRRNRRARALAAVGSYVLLLLLVDANGFWKSYLNFNDAPDNVEGTVVGLGLTRWELVHQAPQHMQWLADSEKLRCKANLLFGYIIYPAYEYASLLNPIRVPAGTSTSDLAELVRSEMASAFDPVISCFDAACRPLQEFVELTYSIGFSLGRFCQARLQEETHIF